MSLLFRRIGWAVLVGLALTQPAHAYLDPGTGSMILQALIGGVAGALVVGRLYWSKIKDRWSALRNRIRPDPHKTRGSSPPAE